MSSSDSNCSEMVDMISRPNLYFQVDKLINDNFTINDFQRYVKNGPWQLKPEMYSTLVCNWQQLWSEVVKQNCAKGVPYLKKGTKAFEKLAQRYPLKSKTVQQFLVNSELAHRATYESVWNGNSFFTSNVISSLIAYDGFGVFNDVKDVDVSNVAKFSKSIINNQIEQMYKHLSGIKSLPHSVLVNYCLCKFLIQNINNVSWTNKPTHKDLQMHTEFWMKHQFPNIQVDDKLVEELVNVFKNCHDQFEFIKLLETWKQSVSLKLKKYYTKNQPQAV